MSISKPTDQHSGRQADSDRTPGAKKPYQKPAVRYEQVFETRALSCGKVGTTQSACAHNRSVS